MVLDMVSVLWQCDFIVSLFALLKVWISGIRYRRKRDLDSHLLQCSRRSDATAIMKVDTWLIVYILGVVRFARTISLDSTVSPCSAITLIQIEVSPHSILQRHSSPMSDRKTESGCLASII